METPNFSRPPQTLSRLGVVSLLTIAFAAASCAADDMNFEHRFASLTRTSPAASPSASGESCANEAPLQALPLNGPHGESLELDYFRGCGWKFAGAASADSADVTKVGFATHSGRSAAAPAAARDPLVVFIDGPTGYTFVWTPESKWKFVGSVAAKR
jgi:hypothetical protein